MYLNSKASFTENSDFKAMSPAYQTFSKTGFKFVWDSIKNDNDLYIRLFI